MCDGQKAAVSLAGGGTALLGVQHALPGVQGVICDRMTDEHLLTGPRGDGRRVIGERERRDQPRRVGDDEGEGEKERFGTGIWSRSRSGCRSPSYYYLHGRGEALLARYIGAGGGGRGRRRGAGGGEGPHAWGRSIGERSQSWSKPIVRGCIGSTLRLEVCPVARGSLGVSDWTTFKV